MKAECARAICEDAPTVLFADGRCLKQKRVPKTVTNQWNPLINICDEVTNAIKQRKQSPKAHKPK
jgi:hypothetical protein